MNQPVNVMEEETNSLKEEKPETIARHYLVLRIAVMVDSFVVVAGSSKTPDNIEINKSIGRICLFVVRFCSWVERLSRPTCYIMDPPLHYPTLKR